MFHKNPSIIPREEEAGKYLVFNPANCLPLIMNKTSYTIWSLCDGTRDARIITREIHGQFDLSTANLAEDQLEQLVTEHINILQRAQLIIDDHPVDPASASEPS